MKNTIGGSILLLIGLVFLAQNMGWISLRSFWKFWPLILIVVGLWMLFGRRGR